MTTKKSYILYIENEIGIEIPRDIFEEVLQVVFREENIPQGSFVNLLLTNDETIKRMNKRFRGTDKLTDVLSFPTEIPGITLLGDIVINVLQAERQKTGRNLKPELQKLFLHGLLHLLGYDHISANQKRIMEEKEKKFSKILKLSQ